MRYRYNLFSILLSTLMFIGTLSSVGLAFHDVSLFGEEVVEVPSNQTSLLRFLERSMEPVGSTMYIWGGGWNKEDTAAGIEARTIGVSKQWKNFAEKQTSSYNYKSTRYQIHNGLDCSGFVGWSLYNSLHTQDGEDGYVMKAKDMTKTFSSLGWGRFVPAKYVKEHRPGDIMSSKNHVYIVIGSCKDGSVVLVHSSPPGVQINGTVSKYGKKNSEAHRLAKQYMKTYYPNWYKKYPPRVLDRTYLTSYSQLRWDTGEKGVMSDPEQISSMSAKEVLKLLFHEK